MATSSELVDHLEALVRAVRTGKPLPENSVLLSNCVKLVNDARRGWKAPLPWTPFERAHSRGLGQKVIEQVAKMSGMSLAEVNDHAREALNGAELFANNHYQVNKMLVEVVDGVATMVWLSIKRIDQQPLRDWRDLQRIKDEICGPSWEAVELFPARERLVDTANQYHLWCIPDRFGFGLQEGMVTGPEVAELVGALQRPFEEGQGQ